MAAGRRQARYFSHHPRLGFRGHSPWHAPICMLQLGLLRAISSNCQKTSAGPACGCTTDTSKLWSPHLPHAYADSCRTPTFQLQMRKESHSTFHRLLHGDTRTFVQCQSNLDAGKPP